MKINKPYTNKQYADLAVYCNSNDCHIEDKGEYLEAVPNEHPVPTIAEQNEAIRQQRESRYVAETDELGRDWQEAVARGDENAQQLGQEWVAAKDAIRAELPYIAEDNFNKIIDEWAEEAMSTDGGEVADFEETGGINGREV